MTRLGMKLLIVERIGGFAGLGAQGSRIKSRGQVSLASLSAEDQTVIEHLFENRAKYTSPAVPDGFCYRLSRTVKTGVESIEVPESLVPRSIASCVKDELA
jgi:hypothetical protein